MKKLIIIWALLTSTVYAQSKPGFYVVGGKVITVQDTSSRNYLKAIENAGVVPSVLQNAASNFLVTSEKAIGSYSLMVAQYPYIGGTAATHAFNLNKPTGLAADFTLQFFGGVTHSANGIQGNGSTGYADTKLKLSSNISATGLVSFGFYTNTTSFTRSSYDIGAFINLGGYSVLEVFTNFTNFISPFSTGNTALTLTETYSKGFYQVTQNGVINGYKNGVKKTGSLSFPVTSIPNFNYYLLASNSDSGGGAAGQFSDKTHCFDFFSSPLTDTQALQQSRIVTFFNSMQNR